MNASTHTGSVLFTALSMHNFHRGMNPSQEMSTENLHQKGMAGDVMLRYNDRDEGNDILSFLHNLESQTSQLEVLVKES